MAAGIGSGAARPTRVIVSLGIAMGCLGACAAPRTTASPLPHPVGAAFDVSLGYTIDTVRVVSGGNERRTDVLGNVDVLLNADLEPWLGLDDTEAFVYLLGNHGGKPSEAVGDLQATDNIEAPESVRVFEAWLQRHWADQQLSVLAGLYDVNSEFDAIQSASLFLHSSHGIGAELGTSGRNGPSIFPVTSLAARLEVRPTDATYVRTVVADGVPGDPRHPKRTTVRFDDGDGVFVAAELGVFDLPAPELRRRARTESDLPGEQRYGDFGRFGFGAWGYTGEFEDFVRTDGMGNPVQRTGSFVSYAFFEKRVLYEP
ncbi:MAG: carbohydrate porin, partial [Planctomycetes bacterium]|nr:carbohydrate porin [Planctomycetota bacterium]